MTRTIAIDFETFYQKVTTKDPGYSVAKLGNWRYTHDPRFDAYLVSVYDGEESWVGHPRDLNRAALDGAVLLSHNAAFDRSVDARTVELGLDPIHPLEWHCTANLSAFLCNRRSLAAAAQYLLKVKVDKGMRDWMSKKTWADAVKAGKAGALMDYARGDVIRCHEIWTRYNHLWPAPERALSELNIRQCARGVAIDTDKLKRYHNCLKSILFYIVKTLPWMWDPTGVANTEAKVTGAKAIADECLKHGIPSPPVKAHDGGEEAFLAWELEYGPRYPWIAKVSQWRSLNKIVTMLETIEERLKPDGTIDFSLLYCGAHTGRFSGGGSALNLQNLRKHALYVRDDYSISDFPELGVTYREIIDVRSLFVPRPGCKFVICDLSQIEPRVLRWIVGDQKFLELVNQGMSPYEAAARVSPSVHWTGGNLKKEDPDLYARVKARELGLGYGCGAKKFYGLAIEGGLKITPEQAEAEVEQWRSSNQSICKLWRRMDDQFKNSLGKNFEVELPSGRTLRYDRVRQENRPYKTEEGKIGFRSVWTADIGDRRVPLYGGKLTENLIQATARDVFGEHLLGLDRAGLQTVFHVHDEAVVEVPLDTDPHEVEKVMSVTPAWLPGATISAEASPAQFYEKG